MLEIHEGTEAERFRMAGRTSERPAGLAGERQRILNLVYEQADLRTVATLRYDLGLVHAAEENWEEAHRHFLEAAEAAERGGDRRLTGLCLMRQAGLYLQLGCLEAAREVAEQAVCELSASGGEEDRMAAVQLLATVLRRLGRPTVADFRQEEARTRPRTSLPSAAIPGPRGTPSR